MKWVRDSWRSFWSEHKKVCVTVLVLAVATPLVLVGSWGYQRKRNAELIQKAMNDPSNVDPANYLNQIDESFRKMTEVEKKKLLADPDKLEKHVAAATYKELKKSFKLIFKLPADMRKKMIHHQAEVLRRKALADPEKIDEIINSSIGYGSLKGASQFYMLELTGKQKAESAEITKVMYEILTKQIKKGKRK
jgi:hypothetical protein